MRSLPRLKACESPQKTLAYTDLSCAEVDRALDNLVKSGKFFPGGPRREPMPMVAAPGRQYPDYGESMRSFHATYSELTSVGQRMHGGRHSVSDFDPSRPGSASNMQNFYAQQRYQGPRHDNPDQMMQAKRRMAAQRERELRNYHQEQQYNRSEQSSATYPKLPNDLSTGVLADMSSTKSDRSMSPSGISEEGRRELIARQQRALYGNEGNMLNAPAGYPGEEGQQQAGATPIGGPRGPSPRNMDRFGPPGQGQAQEPTDQALGSKPTFGGFDQAISSGTGPNDDGGHSRQLSKSTTAPVSGGMAPIGSRPNPPNQPLNKRTTSPMPFGFGPTDQNNERSNSSNSNANPPKEGAGNTGMGTWGTGSGVWGNNKIGTTSVWG
jgi:hypothetical protein